jgi:hypothetical protein
LAKEGHSDADDSSGWGRVSARVEAILKALSLIGLGLYVVGLLVVNAYFAKYGITDFALLKPQCLLTGAWSLLLIGVASLPAFAFVEAVSDKKLSGVKRYSKALLGLVLLTYLSTFMAFGIFALIGHVVLTAQSLVRMNLGVPGWYYLLLTMLLPCIMRVRPTDITVISPKRDWPLKAAPFFAVSGVLGIFVIAFNIYDSVDPEMGGGRPLPAGFFFSQDGKALLDYLRHTARPFHDKDPANTVAGELIYTASDRYVFRVLFCRGPDQGDWNLDNIKRFEERVVIDKKVVQALLVGGAPVGATAPPDKCPYNVEHFTRADVTPD